VTHRGRTGLGAAAFYEFESVPGASSRKFRHEDEFLVILKTLGFIGMGVLVAVFAVSTAGRIYHLGPRERWVCFDTNGGGFSVDRLGLI